MSQERILLVEDERAQREGLARYLEKKGFEVDAYDAGETAMTSLRERAYSILITDLRLPGMSGLDVVRRARQLDESLGVLLITAYASVESAIEALRVGAHDYLLKPLILEDLSRKVQHLIDQRELLRENARLRQALQHSNQEHAVVTESLAMQEVAKWIDRAADSQANVLITGETGTGKEVIARAIHRRGPASSKPFVPVNLAAVPGSVMESELFGHERGAFTGASRQREGLLRAAESGVVFLDEIAELPLELQPKLLRAIEAREVRPLGSDRSVPFAARIIAATHRDLRAMITAGTFREDLYYRLYVLHIDLPPLRDRREDIPRLVRELLTRHAEQRNTLPPAISVEAMQCLCAYTWRGNVRELSNVLERAMILVDDDKIDIEHIPEDVRGTTTESLSLSDAVERFERTHIASVLRSCGGNRERAAEELGISPATLYRRLERLQLKGFAVHPDSETSADDSKS